MYYQLVMAEDICHHGIKGQKWGVRRYQNKDGSLTRAGRDRYRNSDVEVKSKLSSIKEAVEDGKKGSPVGNQNCQLCAWAMEANFRGINILPRPVHSPRDVIFTKNGWDIVKGATKESISDKADTINKVLSAGDGSRFYIHVNWSGTEGGHEFILTNRKGEVYVIDAQVGYMGKANSAYGATYLDGVNYRRSFLSRMDDKPLNDSLLRLNDKKYMTEWDPDKDIPYMREQNLLAPGDEEFLRKR